MRFALFPIALAATTVCAQETLPLDTLAKVKQATCYIRIDDGVRENRVPGSGFMIKVDGTTGYLVTNAHVVAARDWRGPYVGRPTAKVYFRSGTKAETTALAEVVAAEPGRDLALLKVVNAANLPAPIAVNSETEPFETMTVYIFGFPFGEELALGKTNPPVNVGRGQVSSIRRDEDERITSVLLDGALNPGDSGGPVVDARGRLVGISKATIRGANIGFAIAVPELLAMLDGNAEEPSVAIARLDDRTATLTFEVPLLDPLGRVKADQESRSPSRARRQAAGRLGHRNRSGQRLQDRRQGQRARDLHPEHAARPQRRQRQAQLPARGARGDRRLHPDGESHRQLEAEYQIDQSQGRPVYRRGHSRLARLE
jgi:Trypsin-like peptidase domain